MYYNAGEGILAKGGEESFREFMMEIFKWYYYDLLPVLGAADHPSNC